MMTVKVQCGCGQRYAFDVQPLNGRMPTTVACPVCSVDGTSAANQIIAQTIGVQSAPPPAVPVAAAPAPRLASVAAPPPPPAPAAPAHSPAPTPPTAKQKEWGPGGVGDTWKWWYYILAGVCLAGYDVWSACDKQSLRPLGGLFLSVFLIAIGIWDFQRKRKLRKGGIE